MFEIKLRKTKVKYWRAGEASWKPNIIKIGCTVSVWIRERFKKYRNIKVEGRGGRIEV